MPETTRLQLVLPVQSARGWFDSMNNNLTLLDRVTVCARLTNRAGTLLERGDVVVVDTDNAESVELTTTVNDSGVIGVVFDTTIIQGNAGLVVVCGYCESIKVVTTGGNIAIGDPLCASATQTYAQKATWSQYVFATALQAAAATGAVSGIIRPVPVIPPDSWVCLFDIGLFDVHLFAT
jgi:hypothetical protein